VNCAGGAPPDAEAAIRSSLRRVTWVGVFSAGLSPWVYGIVIVALRYGAGWEGLGETFGELQPALLLVSVAACALSLPVAWLIERLLARRVLSQSSDAARRAANLSAVGLVALTVVHTPAVFGLLYYLFVGDVGVAVAIELWAFLTYLPMQWQVNRQIRMLRPDLKNA